MDNNIMTTDTVSKINLVKNIANKTRGPYTPGLTPGGDGGVTSVKSYAPKYMSSVVAVNFT